MSNKILVDEDFYIDRCNKATDRLIRLISIGKQLEEILNAANQLDHWNGYGEGYTHVREELLELSQKLRKL